MTPTIPAIDLLHIPGIAAFCTERGEVTGGDPYSGFSTCSYTGDSPAHVGRCRDLLARNLRFRSAVFPVQTHSSTVLTIRTADVEHDSLLTPKGVDALVTDVPEVALCIHTADCVPVLLADPAAGVIGIAHSGWKGTVAGIARSTVEAMQALGAEPSRIQAALGPCICGGCFEVGEEVACLFPEKFVMRSPGEKPHVDLPLTVMSQLAECVIRPEAIAPPPGCSRCNPHRFFSARRLGTASGRTLSAIMLTGHAVSREADRGEKRQ